MKAKILSWSAFLIIVIGFTAFGQLQVMQLDDGTKLTLLGDDGHPTDGTGI